MTGSLFLFFSIWIGFIAENKFNYSEKNFWAKLSFAIIIGTLFSTWLTFSLSLLIGFTKPTLFLSIFLMALFSSFSLFRNSKKNPLLPEKLFRSLALPPTHLFLLLFVMPFFIFGVWETKAGDILYLGNYTDLSYHLSIISAFLEQTSFLPENPQSAGAKMSYHFLVNFHSAILCLGDFNLFLSVIIPQILYSFALATMLYHFYKLLLKNRASVFFSSTLLIMGHIAFFNLLFAAFGYLPPERKLDFASWHSTRELILYPFFNFLDPVINYFHPQRPFLFAFPLALIVLSGIYKSFLKEQPRHRDIFFLALLLGLTPLFHIHTFLVFAPILVMSVLFMKGDYRLRLLSLLPLILSAAQIWFILSQPKAPGFSGFDVHELGGGLKELNIFSSAVLSRIVFWIRATGFPLILGLCGIIFYFLKNRCFVLKSESGRKNTILLIFFTIPFLFFLLINFYRFSPSWGDCNKFFLYFELILVFFAGNILGEWFSKNLPGKICTLSLIFVAAIAPSAIEAGVIFLRPGSHLFTNCEKHVAKWIKLNTEKDSIFLTTDDVIHYVPSLAGRKLVDGSYTWNTGFKKPETDNDVRRIYKTGKKKLIRKYHITHILVGPEERRKYVVNENKFKGYNLVFSRKCANSKYRIYDVRGKKSRKTAGHIENSNRADSAHKKVFLSNISPVEAVQNFYPLSFDVNVAGQNIILNGKKYSKGLGTHADSEIVFWLNKKYSFFESDVGLDDTEDRTSGSIVFKVFADGELICKTPVMRWDSETRHIRADIAGADTLTLLVEDAGDGDTCDHASWAGAAIY